MSAAINTSTGGELTVGQLADQAAQAVRELNHLTRPAVGGLSGPVDAAELAAALCCLTGWLPQLLGQLSGWLVGEARAGRLRADAGSPLPDPAAAVAAVTDCLTQAAHCAQRAGRALDGAHQNLAHLAAAGGINDQAVWS